MVLAPELRRLFDPGFGFDASGELKGVEGGS